MKRLVSSCLLGAGLSLSGCAVNAMNTEPEVRGLSGQISPQRLENPQSGAEVVLSAGNQLIIELRSNPTTGYRWFILSGTEDGALTLASEDYVSDPSPPGMVGVGGKTVFVFDANREAEVALQLGYGRSPSGAENVRDIAVSIIPR